MEVRFYVVVVLWCVLSVLSLQLTALYVSAAKQTEHDLRAEEEYFLETSLPGFTRSVVKSDHALITPESFVFSGHPTYMNSAVAVLIAPNTMPRARFAMLLVDATTAKHGDSILKAAGSSSKRTASASKRIQRIVYVLEGAVAITGNDDDDDVNDKRVIRADGYAYFKPQSERGLAVEGDGGAKFLVYESEYSALHHDDDDDDEKTNGECTKAMPEDLHGYVEDLPLVPCKGATFTYIHTQEVYIIYTEDSTVDDRDKGQRQAQSDPR